MSGALLAAVLLLASPAGAAPKDEWAPIVARALSGGAEQVLPQADAADLGFKRPPNTRMLASEDGLTELTLFVVYKDKKGGPAATHLVLTTLEFLDAEKTKANGWTFLASPAGRLHKAVEVETVGDEPRQKPVELSKRVRAAFEKERSRFLKAFARP